MFNQSSRVHPISESWGVAWSWHSSSRSRTVLPFSNIGYYACTLHCTVNTHIGVRLGGDFLAVTSLPPCVTYGGWTLHYTTLHYTGLHCTALKCTALHKVQMQCTAMKCHRIHMTLSLQYSGNSLWSIEAKGILGTVQWTPSTLSLLCSGRSLLLVET